MGVFKILKIKVECYKTVETNLTKKTWLLANSTDRRMITVSPSGQGYTVTIPVKTVRGLDRFHT